MTIRCFVRTSFIAIMCSYWLFISDCISLQVYTVAIVRTIWPTFYKADPLFYGDLDNPDQFQALNQEEGSKLLRFVFVGYRQLKFCL